METPEDKRNRQYKDSYDIIKWSIKYGIPLLAIVLIIYFLIRDSW